LFPLHLHLPTKTPSHPPPPGVCPHPFFPRIHNIRNIFQIIKFHPRLFILKLTPGLKFSIYYIKPNFNMVQTHQSHFLLCLPVIMVHIRAIFASDVLPLHLTGVNYENTLDNNKRKKRKTKQHQPSITKL
jgi:hypothetical protein